MVCQLIKFFNAFYVSPYDSLLLFKDPDISINFHVCKLLVMEVPERSGDLIFSFVIEEDVKCSSVVVDLKLGSHRLLYSSENSSAKDDIVDWISIIFANIIRSRLRVCNHFNCYRSEHFGLSSLLSWLPSHIRAVIVKANHVGVLLIIIASTITTSSTAAVPSAISLIGSSSVLGHEKAARCVLISKHF